MRHIKPINEFNTDVDILLLDIKDILLDLEDVEFSYHYTKILTHIEGNTITLYDHRRSPFVISDLDETIDRIKEYLKMNGRKCVISYGYKSSHYFTKKGDKFAKHHPTTESIKITIK